MEERAQGTEMSTARRSSPLLRIIGGTERIDIWLNYIGMVFTMLLMLITVYNVTARWLFNSPMKGYIDAEEMLMALLVFLSAAYCQLKNGNIRFEMFLTNVLKGGRPYYVAEIICLLIAISGFALIAVFSTKSAIYALVTNDVTMSVHWPIWPAKMGVAIGSIFLCVRFAIQIVDNSVGAVAGRRPAREMWLE